MVSNVKKHVSADIWGTVVFFIRALYYCITTPLASSVMKSIRYKCVLEKFSRHYSNESLWCWTSTETIIIKKYNSHPLTLSLYFVICFYRCPGSRITDGNVLWFGEGDHHPIVVNDGIQINFSVMHHAEAFLGKNAQGLPCWFINDHQLPSKGSSDSPVTVRRRGGHGFLLWWELIVVPLSCLKTFAGHLFSDPRLDGHWSLSAASFSLSDEVSVHFRGCQYVFQWSPCDPDKPVSPDFFVFQVWHLQLDYSVVFPWL